MPLNKIPELINLEKLSKKSTDNKLPIMLAFGAEWCEFCEILKEEVLDPMALSGDYENKWCYMRYVSIDDPKELIYFDGSEKLKSQWFDDLNLDVTPVVIFINGQGNMLTKPIVGISNIEFYPAVIHQNLNESYKKIGNTIRIQAIKPKAI